MPQRFVCHDGPEIRAADSDIDDAPNPLSGVAAPCSASNLSSEIRHLFENRMNIGNDIFSIDDDPFPFRRSYATCNTERSSVTLIFSPRNMASIRDCSPHSAAN